VKSLIAIWSADGDAHKVYKESIFHARGCGVGTDRVEDNGTASAKRMEDLREAMIGQKISVISSID
jgi:hypothetical protein